MPRASAGLLMFRRRAGTIEVLLAHPGGPLWANKDAEAWTIPKGEIAEGEDPLTAARREFEEETGIQPEGVFYPLGSVRQKSGKIVHAWAFEGDADPDVLRSNSFQMQWPPGSGQLRSFPEVDRVQWFSLDEARRRINPAQAGLIDALESTLVGSSRR